MADEYSFNGGGVSTMATGISSNITTNISATDDEDYYHWNFAFAVSMATILSIAAFLAVVGNAMVLTVVIRHRGMRTRTNLFLVNLAIADFLVGLMVMPVTITTLIKGDWIFGSGVVCNLNGWMNAFCLVASIHTLMYISVHKHYSITKPLANHFKLKQILGMMAASWVWAAVCAFINVLGFTVRYKPGTTHCGPVYPNSVKAYIFHAIIQVTCIFIPVIVLVYCYARMFRAIRAHSKRLQQNTTLEQDVILAQQKKVTITLFIVLAAFVVCALPFNLYSTYTTIQKDKHFSPYINPVAYGFLYLNSALNPIIYAFRSPSFREGYKEILCQTPTYVIADGRRRAALVDGNLTFSPTAEHFGPRLPSRWPSDLASVYPVRSRMSSFLSILRRPSTTSLNREIRLSCASMNSLNSLGSLRGAPCSLISGSSYGKQQKGMASMIRASRKYTTQSSVICRNGDVIIVKDGKIVSIRRDPAAGGDGIYDSTPFIHNGVPGSSDDGEQAPVAGQSMSPGSSEDKQADVNPCEVILSHRQSSVSTDGSDNVFDGSSRYASASGELLTGSLLDLIIEKRRLLSTQSEMDLSDSATQPSVTFASTAASSDSENSYSDKTMQKQRSDDDLGLIVSIKRNDSIQNLMSLMPLTHDRVHHSDLFLDKPSHEGVSADSQGMKKSKRMLRSFLHLPSVEYSKVPASLKHSKSDFAVHKSGLGNAYFSAH